MLGDAVCNCLDDGAREKHSYLHSIGANVGGDGVNLGTYHLWLDGHNGGDAAGVLCGDGGDGSHAIHSECRHRFQVGLYAGTARGVGTGNGEARVVG